MLNFKKHIEKQGWTLIYITHGRYELSTYSPLGQKHTFIILGESPLQLIESIHRHWKEMREFCEWEIFYDPNKYSIQEISKDYYEVKNMLYKLYESLIAYIKEEEKQ